MPKLSAESQAVSFKVRDYDYLLEIELTSKALFDLIHKRFLVLKRCPF